jgi:L-seryl-tRNA(Ser) seleniumtransferase
MKTDHPRSLFAALPAVDRLLNDEAAGPLTSEFGRPAVTDAIRRTLSGLRETLKQGAAVDVSAAAVLARAACLLVEAQTPSLRPVYNLTGTVLHTNLGRAVLPKEAIDAVVAVAGGASNLEFDLERGRRGDRDSHIEDKILGITGAEAATLVNNNAAAVLLTLNTLGQGEGVAVSRGELVEIGGSFRIPDVMARAGCRLVEVGTTNRTHEKDFAAALDAGAAMIMKVHTSNYVIEGFTAEVPEARLAAMARAARVPFINDLGSGTLIDLERFGLPHEPTPMDALEAGADVVTFSGDKLLGGPQAGIICGRRDLIERIKRNPMKRALRCDKMTIAALGAVLGLYADPDRLPERLPALRWLTRPVSEIDDVATAVAGRVAEVMGNSFEVKVVDCESQIGSGALPTRTVTSRAVTITPGARPDSRVSIDQLAEALRRLPIPVVGRINEGRLLLDMRCLDDVEAFKANLAGLESGG